MFRAVQQPGGAKVALASRRSLVEIYCKKESLGLNRTSTPNQNFGFKQSQEEMNFALWLI